MSEAKQRQRTSRIKRLDQPRHMALTDRDKEVIKAVNDFRVMRQDQIQRLFFPSRNTAQVRLQLLWQHGFLQRSFLPVVGGVQTSPILYTIDEQGTELLQAEFDYDKTALRGSRKQAFDQKFLEHTLGLSEIRVAAELSCRKHSYSLKTWLDEKVLKADYDRVEVRGKLLAVLPDAYFVVNIGAGDVHFFVEFDTGTEDLKFIRQKLLAYWAYYMSGKCKTRYGTNLIRVLTITTNDNIENKRSRLNSLRQIAGERPEHSWFWFSGLPQLQKRDFLTDPMWLMPTEFERKRLLGV